MINNDKFMLSECGVCRAIASKEKINENWYTGEFIERGERGYDFLRYKNGNKFVSHGYCNPCYEKAIEELDNL